MLSLGLSLLLLLGWTVIGAAIIFGARAQAGLLRSWLLAPAVGLAVQTLLVCIFNQAGMGTDVFARPLAAITLAIAVIILVLRRIRFPARSLLPFYSAAAVFVLWAGWPAFRLGFNWISFVNDDFTNYCLSAERFRQNGFFVMPTLEQLAGRDNSQYFFFMHVSGLMRFGSEHALALVASLTGINALKIFMPLILAFGGAQICAAAALVLHFGRWRRHARWTAWLLALSPVFIFGSLYQLIAQVGGLALMLAVVALLTSPFPSGRPRWLIFRRSIPTTLLASALTIFYPEITPFAILTVVSYFGLELICLRRLPGWRVVLLNFTLIALFVILRYNLVSYIYTLGHQAGGGFKGADLRLTLFPFYLIPSGFAILFGFQTLNAVVADPYGSVIILFGAALFVSAGVWALRSLRRLLPIGCMLAIFTLMAVYLFFIGNDFGLYKLAMFIQPPLWAGVAAVLGATRKRWVGGGLALAIVALGLPTTWLYTSGSTGMKHSGLTELDHASEYLSHLPPPATSPRELWESNLDNVVTLKLVSNLYRGTDIRYLSRDFFNFSTFLAASDWPLVSWYPDPGEFDRALTLQHERDAKLLAFDTLWDSRFDVVQIDRPPTAYAAVAPGLGLFNKLNPSVHATTDLFEVIPSEQAINVLAFIHSGLGNHYYLGDRRVISFTQSEEDAYVPGGLINAVGRFFLFRVEHPSPEIYLRVSATKTTMGPAHKFWSPTAVVHGVTDVPLALAGGGAFNRMIGPLQPVMRDGAAYVALDFGEEPAAFPIHRSGLAALYHRWIPLDYRLMVAFARDISVLSPQQVAALPIPRSLKSFPRDVATATGLQFSGIYEDGWISPAAQVQLGVAHPGESLHFRGMVPQIEGRALVGETMTVTVNRDQNFTFPAPIGPFDWSMPIAHPGPVTDFTVRFSGHHFLPGLDQRPVGGRLLSLELGPSAQAVGATLRWDEPTTQSLPFSGIDSDGWTEPECELTVPVRPGPTRLTFNLEYPGGAAPADGPVVQVWADNQNIGQLTLHQGGNMFSLPFVADRFAARVDLIADKSFSLPAPDGRHRAYHFISVQAEPIGDKP